MKWLLQNTDRGSIQWQRQDYGMYFTDIGEGKNRVHIEIGTVSSRYRPARVIVKFASPGLGEVCVQQLLQAVFSTKYESEDDEKFAQIMKQLQILVSNQHADRKEREKKNEDERKQAIYSRLLNES